jgi:hypothetical protein
LSRPTPGAPLPARVRLLATCAALGLLVGGTFAARADATPTPFDTATGTRGTAITLPATGTTLAMSPSGATLFVASSGKLFPVDTAAGVASTTA